jgi:magnesium-transporting ATPase (P-type)
MLAGEATPYGEWSVYAVQLLIGATFALGIPEMRLMPRGIRVSGIVFFAALILSTALSSGGVFSWYWLFGGLAAGMLFATTALGSMKWRVMTSAFALGLAAPATLGAVQVMLGSSGASTLFGLAERSASAAGDSIWLFGGERLLRAYGSFPHPNIFGGYVAVAILLLIPMKSWPARIGAIIMVFLLALTMSQAAWLGCIVGLGLLAMLQKSSFREFIKRRGAMLSLICLILGTTFLAFIFSMSSFESMSLSDRAAQFAAYPSILENPIIGLGPGQFAHAWQAADTALDWWKYQPIHNIPLLLFAEIGLIGLMALLWFLHEIDAIAYRNLSKRPAQIAFSAGAALAFIALLDHYLFTLWPGLALSAFVLGLTVKSGLKT